MRTVDQAVTEGVSAKEDRKAGLAAQKRIGKERREEERGEECMFAIMPRA